MSWSGYSAPLQFSHEENEHSTKTRDSRWPVGGVRSQGRFVSTSMNSALPPALTEATSVQERAGGTRCETMLL